MNVGSSLEVEKFGATLFLTASHGWSVDDRTLAVQVPEAKKLVDKLAPMVKPEVSYELSSLDVLATLFHVFDGLGVTHDYDLDAGELNVLFGDTWVNFHVDVDVLKDNRKDVAAVVDADMVAEGYWRQ